MTLSPGTLVLVPFPYTDLSSSKRRPALVVSSTQYNDGHLDAIFCGVTSNLQNADHGVLLTDADMAKGKLKATSRIKADKIQALEQSIVQKVLGRVDSHILDQVRKELATILDLPE